MDSLGAGVVQAAFLSFSHACVAASGRGIGGGARRRRPSDSLIFSRSSESCSESSGVRDGASPRQNGTFGDAPWASSTSTRGSVQTRRIRHEVLPSSMMSPARLSTAKSSSTVPTVASSGVATTVYSAFSEDGAAAGDGGEARATPPRVQAMVHAIAEEICAVAAALGGDAFGEHGDECIEIFARQIAIRICAAH